jgi:hypothetical protein
MPSAARTTPTKFQRHRAKRKAEGMKLVRIWIPDPHAPEIAACARREAEALRGAADEQEVLDFIEASTRDIDDWTP